MAADPRTRTPLPLMRLMTAGLRSLDFCLKDCDGEGGRGGEGRMRGNRAIGQGTHRSRGRTQEKANENARNARLKPFPFSPFHFWLNDMHERKNA